MESSAFDRLTRLVARSTGRRAALTVATAGTAALVAEGAAAQNGNGAGICRQRCKGARGPRGLRGKQGKPGKRGKQGPAGPSAGSGIKVVPQTCNTPADQADGATHDCTAPCGAGFVATGGGFEMDNLFSDLAIVRQSQPAMNNNVPVGWFVQVEFIDLGQLTYEIYAVCVPE